MTSPPSRPLLFLLAVLLSALTGSCDTASAPEGCGDGEIAYPEECDAGEGNSDTSPGACRTDCSLARCGDGVTDAGEDCDDGGLWGGDGCSPTCRLQEGPFEVEPNDTVDQFMELVDGSSVNGSLPAGDLDCYGFQLVEGGWIQADVRGEEDSCPLELSLSLFDPSGALVAVGTPGTDGGCSPIDPTTDEGAAFAGAGQWVLCAQSFHDEVVSDYTLQWELGEDSCSLELPVLPSEDIDGDGLVAVCDADDDGDGVSDEEDNCPDAPNGPDMPAIFTGPSGFLRHWLLIGPFEGTETEADCRPSEDQLLGDDATAAPAFGDLVDELAWHYLVSANDRIALGQALGGDAPRESYSAVWLRSAETRPAVLAIGPDDGARMWLNGVEVGEIDSCQGTYPDDFLFDVELVAGWNRLMVKVRDNGGGWGMYLRFLDKDGQAIEDLEISLLADSPWVDDQNDADGDGQGDVCDDDPLPQPE